MNIYKGSLLVAVYKFREELRKLNLSQSEISHYTEEFVRWYKRSENYDLASSRIFEEIMNRISRKNIKKQSRNELVRINGKVFTIANVKYVGNGEYIFDLTRQEFSENGSINLECIKVKAKAEELEIIKSYELSKDAMRLSEIVQMNPVLIDEIKRKISELKDEGYDNRSIAFMVSGLFFITFEDAFNITSIV